MRVTREENAHFANFTHMGYSLFRDTPQQTTKQDIVLAKNDQCPRACQWFGEPVYRSAHPVIHPSPES